MKGFVRSRAGWPVWTALALAAGMAAAQTNQSSATSAYYGSVTARQITSEPLHLSFDDAIRLGLENNLALTLARQDEKQAAARRVQDLGALLPVVTAEASTGVHQYNLAALGFRPGTFAGPSGMLPGGGPAQFPMIVRADVTTAQAKYQQQLFNLPAIDLYRAAQASEKAAFYNTQSSRGLVVLTVGTTYLQAVAAAAQVDNAQALMRTAEALLSQARAAHEAGTAANLDELRARVEYQSRQQQVIQAENAFEKEKIALNREIGLPDGQQILLGDAAPYSELAAVGVEEARRQAYANRQDYLSLQQQVRAAGKTLSAAKHERLPALSFGGYYGVTGVSGGIAHGNFAAIGSLNLPLFEEGRLRGDRAVADARLSSAMAQLADLRTKIDAQLRDSLLDVQSTAELVRVAQSNVELATKTLEQVTDRFQAGIDDNLPVVQAQGALANAQAQLVNSLYRYNQAKLGLARNLGVVDTQYKAYLGR